MKNLNKSLVFLIIQLFCLVLFVDAKAQNSNPAPVGGACALAPVWLNHDTWNYIDNNGQKGKISHDASIGEKTDKTKESWVETTSNDINYTFSFYRYPCEANVQKFILFDKSRNIYLKLDNSSGQWSVNNNDWYDWVRGSWQDNNVSASTRNIWKYSNNNKNSLFTRKVNNLWVESNDGVNKFYFTELLANSEYIELYDNSRSFYLRLYTDHGDWSTDPGQSHVNSFTINDL